MNFNGREFLPKCFQSLSQVSYPDFEVILVDNNSIDGSADWFKSHIRGNNYRLMELSSNLHFAGGNNVGAKQAEGEYIFFLNNDVRVKPDFIQKAVDVILMNKDVGICQSNLVDFSLPDDFVTVDEPREVLYAQGAALLISRRLFESLRGFDESFMTYVEDMDLSVRARLMGHRIMFVPQSIVFHVGNGTGAKLNGYGITNYTRNFPSMLVKNLQLRNLAVAMPLFAIAMTRDVAKNIIDRRFALARFRLTGLLEFTRELSSTFVKRKEIQENRVKDDSEVFRFSSLIELAVKFRL